MNLPNKEASSWAVIVPPDVAAVVGIRCRGAKFHDKHRKKIISDEKPERNCLNIFFSFFVWSGRRKGVGHEDFRRRRFSGDLLLR